MIGTGKRKNGEGHELSLALALFVSRDAPPFAGLAPLATLLSYTPGAQAPVHTQAFIQNITDSGSQGNEGLSANPATTPDIMRL